MSKNNNEYSLEKSYLLLEKHYIDKYNVHEKELEIIYNQMTEALNKMISIKRNILATFIIQRYWRQYNLKKLSVKIIQRYWRQYNLKKLSVKIIQRYWRQYNLKKLSVKIIQRYWRQYNLKKLSVKIIQRYWRLYKEATTLKKATNEATLKEATLKIQTCWRNNRRNYTNRRNYASDIIQEYWYYYSCRKISALIIQAYWHNYLNRKDIENIVCDSTSYVLL